MMSTSGIKTSSANRRTIWLWGALVILIFIVAVPALRAQQSDEFDDYKLRLDTFWFYSNPTGTIQGSSDTVPVDIQKDLGFNSYSTFSGKVDWKFTHKNHFYVAFSPFYTSRQTTLVRDITFQGQTFTAGTTVNSDLHAFLVAPGYQYDIIRRKRGHLGLGVQIDLFNTNAKIAGVGQESGGSGQAVSASGSLLAPIPVAGPEFRLYLTDSPPQWRGRCHRVWNHRHARARKRSFIHNAHRFECRASDCQRPKVAVNRHS